MPKVDVLKENLQFQQFIKENCSKVELKDEYLIPDTHPDVIEILIVEAKPVITDKEVVGDKLIVEGNIEYNIIYIPGEEGETINSVKYTEKFSDSINVEDLEHKINYDIECKIEHIDSKIMNERKIEIESTINVCYSISKNNEFEVIENLESPNGIQVLKESEAINRIVMNQDTKLISKSMIRVGMDKPQINKIINYSVILHKKEIKVTEDKVFLSCYCKLNILYSGGENNELYTLGDDFYISKEEEVQGIKEGIIAYGLFNVENVDIAIEEDDLGENRIVNTELTVNSNIKGYSDEKMDIVEDAYSTEFPIELVEENHNLSLIHSIKTMEISIKDNLYVKEGDLKPEYIQYVFGYITDVNKTINDNKINIDGNIKVIVLYKASSDEKMYGTIKGDVPFSTTLDVPGINKDMKTTIKYYLEEIEGYIEANTIAIKANINISAKVQYNINREFISDVLEREGEKKGNNASATIYVVSKGETLWKLAKKFNTTIDELVRINSIEDPDVIKPGDKLIIPGKAIF